MLEHTLSMTRSGGLWKPTPHDDTSQPQFSPADTSLARTRNVPILGAAAFVAVVARRAAPLPRRRDGRDRIHFVGVALGAGIAAVSAVALTVTGARLSDGYAVLVGCAFAV